MNAQIQSMSMSRDNTNRVIRVAVDHSSAIQITYLMNKDMGSPIIETKSVNSAISLRSFYFSIDWMYNELNVLISL